jgi:hypothetical protein
LVRLIRSMLADVRAPRISGPGASDAWGGRLAICGALMIVAALALPWYGWLGLRTVGPLVGLAAATAVLGAAVVGSRGVAALGSVTGLVACGLIAWRLTTPPSGPLSYGVQSDGALALTLAGSLMVTAGGMLALEGRRSRPGPTPNPGLRDQPPASQASRAEQRVHSSDRSSDRRDALAAVCRAALTSRLLVWSAGVLGLLKLGLEPTITPPTISRPFGSFGNLLTAPASAWDAPAYLLIAQHGYAAGPYFSAYFPLYPALVRAGAWSPQATLVTAILVSLAALVVALYLLHRLVAIDLGARTADLAVALMAFFPMAFFFSAVYTESLFLALSIGAFYAARRQWWARAGLAGALAATTRVTGLVVLVPLVILYLYGPRGNRCGPVPKSGRARLRDPLIPRYPLRPDAAYLLLVPAGALAFFAYQGVHGDALAPLHVAQTVWHRSFEPLAGIGRGFTDAVRSLHQLTVGPTRHVLPTPTLQTAGQLADPLKLAAADLVDFGFLVFAIAAVVGAARRLPPAYGAYGAASLAMIVSSVTRYEPLVSLPRYVAVLFPCQIWLAVWVGRGGRGRTTLAVSAGLLAFFASQFAAYRWVA